MSASEDQIAGRPALESVWKRTWVDTAGFRSTPYFWLVESLLITTAVILTLLFTENLVMQVVIPIVPLIAGLAIPALGTVYRAPFVQRNEARKAHIRVLEKQSPKVTIVKAEVHQMPDKIDSIGIANFRSTPYALRIHVQNDSDGTAKNCTARLLDIKPLIKWLERIEGNRSVNNSTDFDGRPRMPLPATLSWSADQVPQIDIPPRGSALLDACYYNDTSQHISPAFNSEDMRLQYFVVEQVVVLSIRVESEGSLPIFFVVKYDSNPVLSEIQNESVIKYVGRIKPNVDHYRECVMTPRPAHWGQEMAETYKHTPTDLSRESG